mgnify:CR=1 FL=1
MIYFRFKVQEISVLEHEPENILKLMYLHSFETMFSILRILNVLLCIVGGI